MMDPLKPNSQAPHALLPQMRQAAVFEWNGVISDDPVDEFVDYLWKNHPIERLVGPFSSISNRLRQTEGHVVGLVTRYNLERAIRDPKYQTIYQQYGAMALGHRPTMDAAFEIAWQRANLHPIVMVSSAFDVFTQPYFGDDSPEHILVNDAFTPRRITPNKKPEALRDYLHEHNLTAFNLYTKRSSSTLEKLHFKNIYRTDENDKLDGTRPSYAPRALSDYARHVLRRVNPHKRADYYARWATLFEKNKNLIEEFLNTSSLAALEDDFDWEKIRNYLIVAGLFTTEKTAWRKSQAGLDKFYETCLQLTQKVSRFFPGESYPLDYLDETKLDRTLANIRSWEGLNTSRPVNWPDTLSFEIFHQVMQSHDGLVKLEVSEVFEHYDEHERATVKSIYSQVHHQFKGEIGHFKIDLYPSNIDMGRFHSRENSLQVSGGNMYGLELCMQFNRWLYQEERVGSVSIAARMDGRFAWSHFGGYRLESVSARKIGRILDKINFALDSHYQSADFKNESPLSLKKMFILPKPDPRLLPFVSEIYAHHKKGSDEEFLLSKTKNIGELVLMALGEQHPSHSYYGYNIGMNLDDEELYREFLDSMIDMWEKRSTIERAPVIVESLKAEQENLKPRIKVPQAPKTQAVQLNVATTPVPTIDILESIPSEDSPSQTAAEGTDDIKVGDEPNQYTYLQSIPGWGVFTTASTLSNIGVASLPGIGFTLNSY